MMVQCFYNALGELVGCGHVSVAPSWIIFLWALGIGFCVGVLFHMLRIYRIDITVEMKKK